MSELVQCDDCGRMIRRDDAVEPRLEPDLYTLAITATVDTIYIKHRGRRDSIVTPLDFPTAAAFALSILEITGNCGVPGAVIQ